MASDRVWLAGAVLFAACAHRSPAVPVPVRPPPDAAEFLFVLDSPDETWARLADADPGPDASAGARRWVGSGDPFLVLPIAPDAVPPEHRHRTHLRFDTGCEAPIAEFAWVTRLTGDPAYSDAEGDAWTEADVLRLGATVLAARTVGCEGRWARDPALPSRIELDPVDAPELATAGREALLASAEAAEARAAWDEVSGEGSWAEALELEVTVLEHPTLGERFVLAHARAAVECGGPDGDVLALYRVGEGSVLEPVSVQLPHDLGPVEAVLDLEGDGELEILARTALEGQQVLERISGLSLDAVITPFFQCPC